MIIRRSVFIFNSNKETSFFYSTLANLFLAFSLTPWPSASLSISPLNSSPFRMFIKCPRCTHTSTRSHIYDAKKRDRPRKPSLSFVIFDDSPTNPFSKLSFDFCPAHTPPVAFCKQQGQPLFGPLFWPSTFPATSMSPNWISHSVLYGVRGGGL